MTLLADTLTRSPFDLDDRERALALAQAGDERAFRELVEPHRRALEVHAYRMLGSPQDAEDVVQETLVRAWRTLERFEGRSSIETWLYRIATNACLDEIRRRPRRPEPVFPYPDDLLAEAETPVVDPAARYAMQEGIELAFLTAIQRLPGRQRAILILRDVLGWTASEVAELLESTVGAVHAALQRARAAIDAALPAESPTAAAPSQRELLYDYIDAWERADVDGLVELLREDAVLRMPPTRSIIGDRAVADVLRLQPPVRDRLAGLRHLDRLGERPPRSRHAQVARRRLGRGSRGAAVRARGRRGRRDGRLHRPRAGGALRARRGGLSSAAHGDASLASTTSVPSPKTATSSTPSPSSRASRATSFD